MSFTVVDTDVLIAHLRGIEAARVWLREARGRGRLAISVVTVTELTGGMRSAERASVWALLNTMHAEPVNLLIARQAGVLQRTYRRSHQGIGIADYIVAATAMAFGTQPATLNVRHFPMFPDLKPPFHLPSA